MNSEQKSQRFISKAEQRTNNVLKSLKVLGNCANKNLYEYNEDDIEKIFNAIEKKVLEIRGKFSSDNEKEFKL